MPEMREKILAASLQCPIGGWITSTRLDELLGIVKHGRFILSVNPTGDMPADSIVRKVRAAGNFK